MYKIDKKCQKCKNNGTAICNRCDMFYDEFEPIDRAPQTNSDRIRGMTDEEMANILHKIRGDCCSEEYWLNWLKQEVEEG